MATAPWVECARCDHKSKDHGNVTDPSSACGLCDCPAFLLGKDERRVVTAPMLFTLTEGPARSGPAGTTDMWAPGEQFEVRKVSKDRVLVKRGLCRGWVQLDDLPTCSKVFTG